MTAHESPPCPEPSTTPSHNGTGTADLLRATEPEVMIVEEAADFLRVGRNQLYDAVGRGDLPHGRIGKTIRLSRSALVRWLAGSCGAASTKGQ